MPPKKIKFVLPYVLELIDQSPGPDGLPRLYNIEPLMKGTYVKHNDNSGGIYPGQQQQAGGGFVRNTPQCFSHFSWEWSHRQLIVCDIQGVGDLYTDPQVHTRSGQGFGQGNCGASGIRKFLRTHVCNDVCRYFQ
eukprot:SAG31_NODE_1942_length_6858_cov_7.808404_4_plen_135_part_00